jgi:NDP-4-keto-2,6-dideoxyhexose 3-C-methyltransferase
MNKRIEKCRICSSKNLVEVLDLGEQTLTGVFPKTRDFELTKGPLILLKCTGQDSCGLLQLAHSYDLDEMYGENYGYRSGLNASMVAHLKSKVDKIKSYAVIDKSSIIVDIGSNDGTTLGLYSLEEVRLVGIDPTAEKFRSHYKPNIAIVPDFFSAARFREVFGNEKARVVTSFSMFYDMEDPTGFMSEIAQILDDGGIWVCEQSYMPLMLETKSYDTVCHEHLEYYALAQILWMAERTGLELVDVELNDVNGGSFSFVAQKKGGVIARSESVDQLYAKELDMHLNEIETYQSFSNSVTEQREELLTFLNKAKADGKRVVALGASTKGNVLLQYCGITTDLVEAIGEVNPDKFGAFAPGTGIPIVNEVELIATNPDYYLVLPWHFRAYFEAEPRYKALNLVFPLPEMTGIK